MICFIFKKIKFLLVLFFDLILNLYGRLFVKDKSGVICFDCLYDENQEPIDTYIFFKYLKKQNIKVKYFVLNVFRDKFENEDGIIFVKNKWQFIFKYLKEIAKSKYIITSFGLFDSIDMKLAKYKGSEYIFLEHGVRYLYKSLDNIYSSENFNKILVPSKFTFDLYKNNNAWNEESMILSGLPRWDEYNLEEYSKNKSVFVFFTWRKTFLSNPKTAKEYVKAITLFLDKLSSKFPLNVDIYFAWHHEILKNNIPLPELNFRINLVKTNEISNYIKSTSLLITDYSSVCWDYFYQNKPVIFYRFDSNSSYFDESDIANVIELKNIDKVFQNCFYKETVVIEKALYYCNMGFVLESFENTFYKTLFWDTSCNCEKILASLSI
ncbi:CDP-glycerol glycerophosphotransferase family protein [bacterium]|nr:CDP-glycerol glycerophosphotransferase family protein [bacterium]